MQDNNHYKIGLSSEVRFRSQIVFIILLIGFLSFFASGVYAGVKSGRLKEAMVEPLKNFVEELLTEEKYAKTFIEDKPSFKSTSSSEVNIEINTNQADSSNTNSANRSLYKYTPTLYPTIASKSWEQIKKEQDEWWARVQEENRRLSEQSKRELEEFRANSQQKMEEFRKQGDKESAARLEQWRQESEQKTQEFKQKYGIQ